MVIVCCAGLHIARRRGGRKDSKLDVIQVNHIAVAGQDAGRLISHSILITTAVSQIHSVHIRGQVVDWTKRSSFYKQLSISNPSQNTGNFKQHTLVEAFGAKQQILQILKMFR